MLSTEEALLRNCVRNFIFVRDVSGFFLADSVLVLKRVSVAGYVLLKV